MLHSCVCSKLGSKVYSVSCLLLLAAIFMQYWLTKVSNKDDIWWIHNSEGDQQSHFPGFPLWEDRIAFLYSQRERNPGNVLLTSRDCQKYVYQCNPWHGYPFLYLLDPFGSPSPIQFHIFTVSNSTFIPLQWFLMYIVMSECLGILGLSRTTCVRASVISKLKVWNYLVARSVQKHYYIGCQKYNILWYNP